MIKCQRSNVVIINATKHFEPFPSVANRHTSAKSASVHFPLALSHRELINNPIKLLVFEVKLFRQDSSDKNGLACAGRWQKRTDSFLFRPDERGGKIPFRNFRLSLSQSRWQRLRMSLTFQGFCSSVVNYFDVNELDQSFSQIRQFLRIRVQNKYNETTLFFFFFQKNSLPHVFATFLVLWGFYHHIFAEYSLIIHCVLRY